MLFQKKIHIEQLKLQMVIHFLKIEVVNLLAMFFQFLLKMKLKDVLMS